MITYTKLLNRLSISSNCINRIPHVPPSLRVTSSHLQHQSTATDTVSKSQQDENVKPFDEMPQPDGSILNKISYLIRNYKKMTQQGHLGQRETFKSLGPIFKTSVGGQVIVLTSDPKAIECMYRAEGKYPKRPEAEAWLSHRRERSLPLGIILA